MELGFSRDLRWKWCLRFLMARDCLGWIRDPSRCLFRLVVDGQRWTCIDGAVRCTRHTDTERRMVEVSSVCLVRFVASLRMALSSHENVRRSVPGVWLSFLHRCRRRAVWRKGGHDKWPNTIRHRGCPHCHALFHSCHPLLEDFDFRSPAVLRKTRVLLLLLLLLSLSLSMLRCRQDEQEGRPKGQQEEDVSLLC